MHEVQYDKTLNTLFTLQDPDQNTASCMSRDINKARENRDSNIARELYFSLVENREFKRGNRHVPVFTVDGCN